MTRKSYKIIRNKFQNRYLTKILILLGIIVLIFGQTIIFGTSYVVTEEDPLIVLGLEKENMTWEVKRSMGIFAQQDIHPHDKYKYYVYTADGIERKYYVQESILSWTFQNLDEEDQEKYWETTGEVIASDYKLIKRDWESTAYNIFMVQDAEYWLSAQALQYFLNITFTNEFYKGKFISIVNIQIKLNDTNYDLIRYTRGEGMLISRETHVNCTNDQGNHIEGIFKIDLTDYSVNLVVSAW
ncbi:MAG: hypothetical protein GF364_03150, partial [Candidatus Lokiarchaeota archaeon]|nr:hypothetical protein [Candidatus Lokiarchaeota archaeon]